MNKYFIFLTFILICTISAHSQTQITDADITSGTSAGEGDLYIHQTSQVIYIGLEDGSYYPINKNLKDILAEANDANALKITNLGTPTNPNDAATKQYVDNLTGGGNWNLTGNSGTSNSNFIGTTDAQDFVLKSNNSEKLRLVNNKGQVLINQAASFNSHPLVIKANGVDVLAFEDASGTPKWHWNLLANGLNFVESNVLDYRLFLENGGNVGINTSNPAAKLHIAGDMQLDNAFKDKYGDTGTDGQVLSSTGTGTDWVDNTSNTPTLNVTKETIGYVFAASYVNWNGTNNWHNINVTNAGITKNGTGRYTVNFTSSHPNGNYYDITFGYKGDNSRDGRIIQVRNQNSNGFEIEIMTGDNGTTADILVDSTWYFNVSATKEVVTGVSLN